MTSLSRREKRTSFFAAVIVALMVMLLGPGAVHAASSITTVKVRGKVNTASTNGSTIESKPVADMGILQAEGSDGAIAVRNFAGGGGFLGAADCTETTADGLTNVIETSNSIVTGILMTGTDGVITVTSDAVGGGQLPLIKFRVNADNPNEFVGLGNGLTTTAPLTFTCAGTNANFVLLGQ